MLRFFAGAALAAFVLVALRAEFIHAEANAAAQAQTDCQCGTDSECQELHGGDGGPEPVQEGAKI